MGILVRFDFRQAVPTQEAFSLFEMDNTLYANRMGQTFVVENAPQFITEMQPTPHGTPPTWLAEHGFSGDLAAAELSDPDQDGLLTWQEYQAGTDPRDGTSCLWIRAAGVTSPFRLSFPSVAGKRYRVEATSDLTNWQVVQAGLLGTGGTVQVMDSRPLGGVPQVYYRLTVE
jgi:hypothetical protein